MAKRRIVLDADAIVALRASARNHYLSERRSLPGRSLYQWVRMDEKHKEGQSLRRYLLRKEKDGWDICAPHGARTIADNAFRNVVDEASRLKKGSGIARSKLLNRPHRKNLYSNASNCAVINSRKQKETRNEIIEVFKRWNTPETRNCIKKRGKRRKRLTPEPEDYDRLTEALLNREEGQVRVAFVTGDMHFICHAETIKTDYRVEVVNFRSLT